MIDDCWNTVGVRGDRSCPELAVYAHCRNCPAHAAAALDVLRSAPVEDVADERAASFAEPSPARGAPGASAAVFSIGSEWLALPTAVVDEIARPGTVRSLPCRAGSAVRGLTNIRGELMLVVSLGAILSLSDARATNEASPSAAGRVLVLRRDGFRIACPVDAVHGIVRYEPSALKDIPSTLAQAVGRYSTKLLRWSRHAVGVIDDDRLFAAVKRAAA